MGKIDSGNEAAATHEAHGHAHRETEAIPVEGSLREIAHDLNNMLTVILGNAELTAHDATLSAASRASIGDIVTAARQGTPLVARLRAMANRQARLGRPDLPRADVDDSMPSVPAAAAGPITSSRRRILYLDDDAPLVSLAVAALTELGHSVSGFVRARDALAALRADVQAFDMVVTDYTMPGMSGLDFAGEVAALRSDLPVMLMSGAIGDALRTECERLEIRDVVEKPVSMRELCDLIHAAATRTERR